MSTVYRWYPSTKFRTNIDSANAELSESLGVGCLISVTHEPDAIDHEGDDYLTIELASPVADATLDAALNAYPTIAAGVTGTFAVTSGTGYTLLERNIAAGEHIVLDVLIHAVLGDAASSVPGYVAIYACVWRNSAGDVQFTRPRGNATGDVNGLAVTIETTATTVRVLFSLRKSGTLSLFTNEIAILSQGQL